MVKKNKRLWRFANFDNMLFLKKNTKTGGYTWLPFKITKKK